MIHLTGLLAVVLYLLAGWYYLRALSAIGPSGTAEHAAPGGRYLLLGALGAHILFLSVFFHFQRTVSIDDGASGVGVPTVLSVVAVLLVAFFLLAERSRGVSVLGVFLAPLASVLAILSGILFHFPRGGQELTEVSPLLVVHLVSAVLAHVLFALAFVASLGVLVKEHYLRAKRLPAIAQKLPPLERIDKLSGALLLIGLALMSLAVLTGIVVALRAGYSIFYSADPRLITSVLTLFVYVVVVIARNRYGWRGRRAALLAVAGFGTVVFSFIGGYLLQSSFHIY